ncbi:MAG: redoxin family protein, partial [Candidatus Bathyarchaeia archaeon]
MAFFSITYPFEIGQKAPSFSNLIGLNGSRYSLSTFEDKEILVLIFMANRCPTARVYTERLKSIQNDYFSKGVQLIGINSDNQYFFALETLPYMTSVAEERNF